MHGEGINQTFQIFNPPPKQFPELKEFHQTWGFGVIWARRCFEGISNHSNCTLHRLSISYSRPCILSIKRVHGIPLLVASVLFITQNATSLILPLKVAPSTYQCVTSDLFKSRVYSKRYRHNCCFNYFRTGKYRVGFSTKNMILTLHKIKIYISYMSILKMNLCAKNVRDVQRHVTLPGVVIHLSESIETLWERFLCCVDRRHPRTISNVT